MTDYEYYRTHPREVELTEEEYEELLKTHRLIKTYPEGKLPEWGPRPKWISVEDEMPEEGVGILVVTTYGSVNFGVRSSNNYEIVCNGGGFLELKGDISISHWMPIPGGTLEWIPLPERHKDE